MGLQDHDLGTALVKVQEFLLVNDFHQAGPVQALPSPGTAAGPEPDAFRKDGGKMDVEAFADGFELIVLLFREAAGEIHHHHVFPVAQKAVADPGQTPAPPAVIPQGKAAVQVQKTLYYACS